MTLAKFSGFWTPSPLVSAKFTQRNLLPFAPFDKNWANPLPFPFPLTSFVNGP